jgi:DNA invertase Pin-like site-specific DNA recombinase
MRVAVYIRVSTDQQSHKSQRSELEEYCRRRGWQDVRWFQDTASGAQQSRRELDEMMAQVRKGKVDAVVSSKLDRLARSLSHLAHLLAELQANKVALVVPTQGIDTTTANPAAMLQLNILGAVAQFERELITERVNAGIAAARQRGVRLGRPPKTQQHAGAVAGLVAEGRSAAYISRILALPYSTTAEIVRELRSKSQATV